VVLTARPTVAEACWAVVLGALAYVPLDLPERPMTDALVRAATGRLHIEPETAAALAALLALAPPDDPALGLALDAARRGWPWPTATRDVGLDPTAAASALLGNMRLARPATGPR
jgi:hypothetical protein